VISDSESEPVHQAVHSRKRIAKLEVPDGRPVKRRASRPEIVEILDSSEDEQPSINLKTEPRDPHSSRSDQGQPAKRNTSHPEIIEILDSSDDEQPSTVNLKRESRDPHLSQSQPVTPEVAQSGPFVITRKMKVDAVEHLAAIPSHWPVPKVDTAYVLDFSDDVRLSRDAETSKRKLRGLDAFLKAEVRDYVRS
jgi:hypothetical protein